MDIKIGNSYDSVRDYCKLDCFECEKMESQFTELDHDLVDRIDWEGAWQAFKVPTERWQIFSFLKAR